MSDFVVKVENLNVWYGKPSFFGASQRVHILHDVSFELKRGEILGLVGESGCGKSTLARTILGIEKDKTGTIEHKRAEKTCFGPAGPGRTAGVLCQPLSG